MEFTGGRHRTKVSPTASKKRGLPGGGGFHEKPFHIRHSSPAPAFRSIRALEYV